MADRAQIEKVINEQIAPRLRMHGGDIQLVSVEEDGTVKVSLKGACAGCPGALMTLRMVVEQILRQSGVDFKCIEAV